MSDDYEYEYNDGDSDGDSGSESGSEDSYAGIMKNVLNMGDGDSDNGSDDGSDDDEPVVFNGGGGFIFNSRDSYRNNRNAGFFSKKGNPSFCIM